jgi:ribosomal protein S27AE
MPDKLVTVMAFSTLWEAEMARSRLQAEGVPTFLKDGYTINMDWLLSNALGGVKVQVAEGELTRARQILSTPFEVDVRDEGTSECLIKCPRCGNENIQYRVSGRRWTFLTWVLCGIPLIWPRKRLFCGKCGYTWNDNYNPE